MSFEKDLELGERFERFVIKVCNQKFDLRVMKNPDKLGVDLIGEGYSLEVKYDTKFRQTGNFFIEYLFNGKRSGILKYPADYFVYGDENNFWVFDRQDLWQLSLVWGTKVKGGDFNSSCGILIEYKEIIDLAIYSYKRK